MLKHVDVLNRHSKTTGEAAYLRTDFIVRGQFVNHRDKDVPDQETEDPEISQENENIMKKMDEDDESRAKDKAIELLRKEKEKKRFKCKVSLEDRNYAQKLIIKNMELCGIDPSLKFPGN